MNFGIIKTNIVIATLGPQTCQEFPSAQVAYKI